MCLIKYRVKNSNASGQKIRILKSYFSLTHYTNVDAEFSEVTSYLYYKTRIHSFINFLKNHTDAPICDKK